MPQHHHPLLIVLFAAALAPLFNELPIRLRLPLVVIELLLGIAIGPQMLDLVGDEVGVRALSALGLCFLFFLAGMDLDFSTLRGTPLRLGGLGWTVSIVLALALTQALSAAGLAFDPFLVGVALATTAIGALLPILREADDLDSQLGRCVLGAGAIGEFAPIILFSLIMAGDGKLAQRSELLITFIFIALTCVVLVLRVRPPQVIEILSRTLYKTSQFPVRLSMLLLASMVVMADTFGLNLLLGAFAAGAVVGLVARGPEAEPFRHKLDAIGFGFLIPIFFIASGTQIDVVALFASPDSLLRVPLFVALFLLVRGAPALLYRRALGKREQLALALLSATSLPLVVVIADLGRATGKISPENAAALVGAAILTVLVFPLIALSLRSKRAPAAAAEIDSEAL
ncbi:MAG: cation:proton antiporter [Betaproteobacteria bacterium]|nr:cation:proton antiporter [Betaproteobacteria bacterium]